MQLGQARVRRIVASAAVAVFGITGCQGGLEVGDTIAREAELGGLHEAAVAGGFEFQAEILSDGLVSYAEYEAAVFATISCLREQGLRVLGPTESSDGLLAYSYGGAETKEESDAQVVIGDECESRYLNYVSGGYKILHAPSAEEMQQRRLEYAECLHDRGYEIHAGATGPEMDELSSAVDDLTCAIQYSDTMVISGY